MLSRKYRSDADIRKHQINTLKVFNDNVIEITENQEYQINFTSGTNELSLHISLSSDFPQEKPVLKISPIISHAWINPDGEIISAPGLLNFTLHSDLGRVVQAIIREFERNPPPLTEDRNTMKSPVLDAERLSPVRSSYVSLPHRTPFPELSKFTLEELKFLNGNEDKQQEILNDLPPIKEQNKLLDELIQQVEDLANENLSKQSTMMQLQSGLEDRIKDVTKLAFENERLHTKYQLLADKYSPNNIKEQLRLAADNAEQESEIIAEKFLKGEIDVENFVTTYTKMRSLCQNRKTKEEKLSQQLASLEKAGF